MYTTCTNLWLLYSCVLMLLYCNNRWREYKRKEKIMKFLRKRFIAALMALSMVMVPAANVCAAEADETLNVSTAETIVDDEERGSGNLLTAGTATIHGGSGSVTVYLPSGNWWADLCAGISYTSENDKLVSCYVKTPDGKSISLGTIYGTGSKTSPQQITHAPAGNYTFFFTSNISSNYDVTGFIYD